MNSMWGNESTQFFYEIGPNEILNAVDSIGYRSTGRVLQLNSMENRVYEVEIECDNPSSPSDSFVVIKFYRPGRWSKEQIQEEHDFLHDLEEAEVNVIAPITKDGKSLFEMNGLFFCVYKKFGGRTPYDLSDDDLEIVGRTIARIHNVGEQRESKYRLELTPEIYGRKNLERILTSPYLLEQFKEPYKNMAEQAIELCERLFEGKKLIKAHGDLHLGNVLWRDGIGLITLDFDDSVKAPSVQDIWLLTPGRDEETMRKRSVLLCGYEEIRDFDYSELRMIEALRTLRFIHFTAWISARYEDKIFQMNFPEFGSEKYWSEQIFDLREQIDFMLEALNPPMPYY